MAGGKPYLGGVSNGGTSTFRAGLEQPDLYQSLTVLPGYAAVEAGVATLADLQITLYVGANDGGWVTSSQRTYDALIANGHSNVLLEIVPGEGHFILGIADEHGSFGNFLANWPSSDLVGLCALLKKRGSRLGGATAQYFLRFIGKDSFILIQDAFNQWHEESGRSYTAMSRVLAMSVDT